MWCDNPSYFIMSCSFSSYVFNVEQHLQPIINAFESCSSRARVTHILTNIGGSPRLTSNDQGSEREGGGEKIEDYEFIWRIEQIGLLRKFFSARKAYWRFFEEVFGRMTSFWWQTQLNNDVQFVVDGAKFLNELLLKKKKKILSMKLFAEKFTSCAKTDS